MLRKKISSSNNVLWKFNECNDSFLSSQFGVAKKLCAKMKIFQEIPLYAMRYDTSYQSVVWIADLLHHSEGYRGLTTFADLQWVSCVELINKYELNNISFRYVVWIADFLHLSEGYRGLTTFAHLQRVECVELIKLIRAGKHQLPKCSLNCRSSALFWRLS